MFQDPTFWVAISFGIFVGLVGRKIWGLAIVGLDERSQSIAKDIQEATLMRDEAKRLLNDIWQKHQEAEGHAEEIIQHAQRESDRLRSEAHKELEQYMKHREKLVDQRITQAEQQAEKDIRDQAIKVAMAAAENLLRASMTKEADKQHTDGALKSLGK
ncbi:MAG: hypothetical protein ACPGXY_02400 [Alphaproteobacteria bacterium]